MPKEKPTDKYKFKTKTIMQKSRESIDKQQESLEGKKSKHNFLHKHPMLEQSLGLDATDHVIVDKEDWEKARSRLLISEKQILGTSPGPYGSLHLGRGNFGQAIQALKDGKKVTRSGWNGKGAWLRHVKNGCPSVAGNVGTVHLGNDGVWAINDFIGMKTTDKMFVPWSPSQTDILAEDWTLVE